MRRLPNNGILSKLLLNSTNDHYLQHLFNRSELHSTQVLWNSLLAETRKTARERGNLAEFYNTEMQVMLDIMLKDLHLVTKKVIKASCL